MITPNPSGKIGDFTARRKVINAIKLFRPGMEEHPIEPPVEVVIVAALSFIGLLALIYLAGALVVYLLN